jgi:hypothetical protein
MPVKNPPDLEFEVGDGDGSKSLGIFVVLAIVLAL